MVIVDFINMDLSDQPTLILKNAGGTPLGVLGYAKNVKVDLKYNEISTLEFELPASVDGVDVPYYDDLVGMRVIEVVGVGQFVLVRPKEIGDGSYHTKICEAYSLEYEFAHKKITIPNGTYRFYYGDNNEDTILGMILELMPSWRVGTVSSDLYNKYRTFSETNENVYNFIKGALQESYNCIFDFDTINRVINVRNANETPGSKPVYFSENNLAKEIEIEENTEDTVTRLDVSGAEGVNIRDVNPTGTNKIIMLDYYMTTDNFSQELIDKYYTWQSLCESMRATYYNLSVRYCLAIMQRETERAKLVDLQGELTSLENVLAVTIEAVSRGVQTQSDLDTANANISAKQAEVNAKQNEIDSLNNDATGILNDIAAIQNQCSFEKYFSSDELLVLDRYIKDGEIAESSFVATTTASYGKEGNGGKLTAASLAITGATVEKTVTEYSTIFDIRGGSISVGGISATIISGVVEQKAGNGFMATAYLHNGTNNSEIFQGGTISISGTYASITDGADNGSITATVTGYMYFTHDATEYEQRSIAWELYDYGVEIMRKMSVPAYTFNITSANFLMLSEFESFKNHIALGEKVYIELKSGRVLEPICIGVSFSFGEPDSLELVFSDSFTSNDSEFRLADLLDKSVSMGKNLSLSRYVYSAFKDSGASTSIKDFMDSALDTSKNAIISSSEQAISWDGAGLRLRKYANAARTAYENEQIWLNNNSVVMTDDAWATAKMAIGKFHDDTLGDVWGIVGPMIVGTILAGENLRIESAKKSGGVAVFTVDSNGCKLYNSDMEIAKTKEEIVDGVTRHITTHILLNPDEGIVIGKSTVDTDAQDQITDSSNLYTLDENLNKIINYDNAKLWADGDGNLHLRGTLHGVDGVFSGELSAVTGKIGGWTLATSKLYSGEDDEYVALSGDTLDDYAIWAGDEDPETAPFSIKRDGTLKATKGTFSGALNAATGTFSGALSAATGSFSGRLVAASGTFAGSLSAATGSFAGSLSAATGSFAGSLSAATGSFAGELSAATGTFSGTLKSATIESISGKIGGWTIGNNLLYSGSGSSYVELCANLAGTHAIWAGAGDASSAPFSVTRGGKLTATDADIKGKVTATSGKIGSFRIDGYSLISDDTGLGSIRLYVGSGAVPTSIAVGNGSTFCSMTADTVTALYLTNVDTINGYGWIRNITKNTAGDTLTITKSDGTYITFSKGSTLSSVTGAWGDGITYSNSIYRVTDDYSGDTLLSTRIAVTWLSSGGVAYYRVKADGETTTSRYVGYIESSWSAVTNIDGLQGIYHYTKNGNTTLLTNYIAFWGQGANNTVGSYTVDSYGRKVATVRIAYNLDDDPNTMHYIDLQVNVGSLFE